MELTTLIIIWTLVTTTAVVLGYARMTIGMYDILQVHFTGDRPPVDISAVTVSKRLRMLDRIGIPLTALSALLALAILALWAMEQAGPR